ncbi:MAG TPA: small ribosomal subunit Rsm22 family protein [Candidatus Saccharimonadales bacterium]|nr:small ribosomal subunit Rsm22 family protein [Candidatus Saccharimonadales bacterium]
MQLPPTLRHAIEQELASSNPARLRAASATLSDSYRRDPAPSKANPPLSNNEQRAAYLAVRLPATYAAVVAVLNWTRDTAPDELHSVLDLGSGPGTALWAATQVFPGLQSATAFERDPRLIEIARRLAAQAEHPMLRDTTWLQGDLNATLPAGSWDLVICSYALNELPDQQRAELVRQAWARTAKLLVIIEPGTKPGFANILAARARLLAQGATLAAPCPNALACPMAAGGDWCHFAARVERTAEHRRLKDATLGHEDEKFSYIAFSRDFLSNPVQRPSARIVRHPKIFSGYTQLTLCREGEIVNTTITRSKKADWRRLKRLGWGSGW